MACQYILGFRRVRDAGSWTGRNEEEEEREEEGECLDGKEIVMLMSFYFRLAWHSNGVSAYG